MHEQRQDSIAAQPKDGAMTPRRIGWLVLWGTALLLLHLFLHQEALDDKSPAVGLRVEDGYCRAFVNNRERLGMATNRLYSGRGLGLYMFHGGPERQYVHELSCRPHKGQTFRVPLIAPRHSVNFGRWTDGWSHRPGRGVTHAGQTGSRGMALLPLRPSREFDVEARLLNVRDAGILFHAEDEHNGLVFAVRPRYNDVLFFGLQDGRPGPVLAIAPFRVLTPWREMLHVVALVSSLLGRICLLLALLLALNRAFLRRRSSSGGGERAAWRPVRVSAGMLCCLTLLAVALFALVSWFGFGRVPHITDETSYLFQARVFAAGRMCAPLPSTPEHFTYEHVIRRDGCWFSKYPPLYSVLLSLGVRVGAPWLVNPVLGGLFVLVTMLLARELATERCMVWVWLLAVSSPFVVQMSAGLMSHVAAALFLALCYLGGLRWLRTARLADLSLSAAALAAAILIRPFAAFLVSVPLHLLFAHHLYAHRRQWRKSVGGLVLYAVLGAFGVLVLVAWNRAVGGLDGLPLDLYRLYDATDSLGFGPDKGTGQRMTWGSWGHTPAKAVRSVYNYLENWSQDLFGWPWRLSLFYVPAALFLRRRGQSRARLLLLLLPMLLLLCGHLFYWATEHIGYGPRYWFEATPGLFILCAVGIDATVVGVRGGKTAPERLLLPGLLLFAGLSLWSLTVTLPDRITAWQNRHSFGNVRVREAVKGLPDSGKVMVLVSSDTDFYFDGLFLNDPFMQQPLIVARDLEEGNERLLSGNPQAAVYRWDGTRLTRRARRGGFCKEKSTDD